MASSLLWFIPPNFYFHSTGRPALIWFNCLTMRLFYSLGILLFFDIAHANLAKRGEGCSIEIQQTPYFTPDGSEFDLQCNTSYNASSFLKVLYKTSFKECIQSCADWGDDIPCLGVQWDHTTTGYDENTYLCYLIWNMTSGTPNQTTIDSAQRRISPSPVYSLKNVVLIVGIYL